MKKKKSNLTPKQKEAIQAARKLVARIGGDAMSLHRVDMTDIDPDILKLVSDTQTRLMTQYAGKLIKTGAYGKPKNEVLDNNVIDLSQWEFMDVNNPGKEILDTIKSWHDEFLALDDTEKFLFFCPCFKEGVLRIDVDRYVYWNVVKTDLKTNVITLFLQDYNDSHELWEPGVSGQVTFKAAEGSSAEVQAIFPTCRLYEDIYAMISPKSMGWNEFETKLWKVGCIEHGQAFTERLAAMDKYPVTELGAMFMHNISLVNMALNKQKAKVRHDYGKNDGVRHETRLPADNEAKKKIRAVSGIVIKSDKPPRRPTRQSVVRYGIESWTCRGHIRRLKSGRLVPVRPSIHHRKALAGSRQDPINTTLIFKE